jgi:hypothetical protein
MLNSPGQGMESNPEEKGAKSKPTNSEAPLANSMLNFIKKIINCFLKNQNKH